MYIDEKNAEDSSMLRQLIKVSRNTITKDADLALQFETTRSMTLANYYISAKEGTLPIIEDTGNPGFLAAELNEFNYIPNGVDIYVDCFLKNTKYIGDDDKRLKEVSENGIYTGIGDVSAPYASNIFEENKYYRVLCSKFGIDPYVSRKAANFDIIYIDPALQTSDVDLELYQQTYKESQELFTRSMYNKGFEYSDKFKSFIKFFLTSMTISRYTDQKLSNVIKFKNYSAKDLRNLFYSFGFFDDSFVPGSFKESVAKNIYKLINGKATDHSFDLIIDDIFANQDVSLNKYVLIKTPKIDKNYFEMSYEDAKNPANFSFDFVKIPYNIKNPLKYIQDNPDVMENKITLEEMKGSDSYLDPNNPDLEKYKQAILDSGMPYIETKYIAVEFNAADNIIIGKKIALLFAMLHYTQDKTMVQSKAMNTDVSLFDLVVAFMYTRALLITNNQPQFLDVGDQFGTTGKSIKKFKQFLAMLSVAVYNESEKSENKDIYNLYNFIKGEFENRCTVKETETETSSEVISLIHNAGPFNSEEIFKGDGLEGSDGQHDYQKGTLGSLQTLLQILEHYRIICELIDDTTYAAANVEQYRDTYASEFIETEENTDGSKYSKSLDFRMDLRPEDRSRNKYWYRDNTDALHGDDRTGSGTEDQSFIKGLTHDGTEYYGSSYAEGGTDRNELYFDRLKMYPLTEYMELRNALAGLEILFTNENHISNEKYGAFTTIEEYILDKHTYFKNKIEHILSLDTWKEELSTYSANISAEIDQILANYAVESVSFGALSATTIASFAASLITFIKSVTVQTKNNSDSDIEIKINDIPEDKLTPFDNVVYEAERRERLYDDGNVFKFDDMMHGGLINVTFRDKFKDDHSKPENGFASVPDLNNVDDFTRDSLSTADYSILSGNINIEEDLYVHVVKQYGIPFISGQEEEGEVIKTPTLNAKAGRILLASTRNILTRGLSNGSDLIGSGEHTAEHAGQVVPKSAEVLQREPEGIPQRTDDYSPESTVTYPTFITEDEDAYIAPEDGTPRDHKETLPAAFIKEDEYEGY